MKKIKLFTMALAAVIMFASCSKENATTKPGNNEPGDKASITISVTGNGNSNLDTKALGNSGTETENTKLNNYIVFLFRQGGALDCDAQESKNGENIKITTATTAAKSIYVVANTGDLNGGLFKTVANEDQLKAVVADLQTINQTNSSLWMSGQDTVKFSKEEGKEKQATADVKLSFVTAKIVVNITDNRTNKTGDKNTITIKEDTIALLFAGKKGLFFGKDEDRVKQTEFYSGFDGFEETPTPGNEEWGGVCDKITVPFEQTNDKYAYYYTFGNDGKTKPTILTIRSTKTTRNKPANESGSVVVKNETVYHPVSFTVTDAGSTIKPGHEYTVNITINGNVDAGGGGDVPKPEDEVLKAEVEVTMNVKKWVPFTVNKEFN